KEDFEFAGVDELGTVVSNDSYIDIHVDEVLDLSLVDAETIKKAGFKVVVDGVNSTGGIAIPKLLKELGVEVVELYCEPTGPIGRRILSSQGWTTWERSFPMILISTSTWMKYWIYPWWTRRP